MMQKKVKKIYFSILAGFLFWGLSGHSALAQMQSPNFQIKSDVIGSFGADSTSPNFQLNDTGGEVGGEVLSGNGQDLWGGFWHNLSAGVFADADGDGTGDVLDNCPEDSNVSQNDSDNDGVGNACDNCQSDSNSNQSDADNDGVGNVCDNCRDADNTNQNDSDNDDIGNACDNCPDNSNNSQTDSDNDDVGDACDNCAIVANANQSDSNNDGVGDACEPPVDNDTDSDGILNAWDNCSLIYNPDQGDADGDNSGDICDSDIDGDNVANVSDNCPLVANPGQIDTDSDGRGDSCDTIDETNPVIPGTTEILIDPKDGVLTVVLKKTAKNIRQVRQQLKKKALTQERVIESAAAAAAVISILPILSSVNSVKDLVLIIANSFGSLFGLVFRRRRDWGIVYDVDTGNPISLVSIGIVNQAGRTLDKRITDKVGSYVLLVPQGKYSLEIEKEGYRLAERDIQFRTLYANNYYGGELDIENYDTINFNIPMRAESVKEGESIHLKAVGQRGLFLRLFYFFTTFLFYAGFVLSIVSIFILPDKKVALAILIAYLFGGLLRNFVANEKGWGKVIGQTGKSAPFATVRTFNKSDGEFVVRTISDELGRYVLILRKGEYTLSVDGVGEGRWSGEVKVGRTSVLKKMIRLSNVSDSLKENEPKV